MLSSGSISRAALLLLAAGLAGGCASRPHAVPRTVSGTADLTALVQSRPGWRGLAQYDAALSRLNTAAQNLPSAGSPDAEIASLPPLVTGESAVINAPDRSRIAPHLSLVEQTLLGSLKDRRAAARAEQVRRQQEQWRREARQRFPVPVRTAEISTDLTLQLLQANVAALTRTLDYWNNASPPAPELDQLKRKVEADRGRLERLIADRIQMRDAARAARAAALQKVRRDRLDYVAAASAALSAGLEADDARVVSAQGQRLSAQRLALLTALARPDPVFVPTTGAAGVLTLPALPETGRASLSAASLDAARAKLTAQRARWVRLLYDDTQAAALDIAAQRHWSLTFGPPRRGERNLTGDLEQALAAG